MTLIARDANAERFRYSTVKGFFLQDEPDTDPLMFDYTKSNFGLINASNGDEEPFEGTSLWEQLKQRVSDLNCQRFPSVLYKLFYLVRMNTILIQDEPLIHYLHPNQGRHGEGAHNVASHFYGIAAWDVCITEQLIIE